MNYANDVTMKRLGDGTSLLVFSFDHEDTNSISSYGSADVPRRVAEVVVSEEALLRCFEAVPADVGSDGV